MTPFTTLRAFDFLSLAESKIIGSEFFDKEADDIKNFLLGKLRKMQIPDNSNGRFQTLALRGWSTQIRTKMCDEVIFFITFKTSYFLYLKSISGIFRVLTLRLNFYGRNIKIIFSETALNFVSDRL